MSITPSAAAAPATVRSSPRIRTPVVNTGMLDSSHPGFSAALTMPATPVVSPPMAMHTKPPKRKNAQLHAGSLAALLPDTQEGGDEQDESAYDGEDGDDDNAQHEHRKPAAAAAAAAAGGRGPRVQWTAEAEEELCNALLARVQETGRLPAQIKTGKHAAVNQDWKAIAASVTKLKQLGTDAVAKACSTKWAKIKKDLKVRSSHSLPAASLADHLLITFSYCCLLAVAGRVRLRTVEGARGKRL
jgi:hypothetical protein